MRLLIAFLMGLALTWPAIGVGAQGIDLGCTGFMTQDQASAALTDANAEQLDPDGDGIACEFLPTNEYIQAKLSEVMSELPEPEATDADENVQEQDEQGSPITDEEEDYFSDLLTGLEESGDISSEVGDLFTTASNDPTLVFDEIWIFDLATQFARWIELDAQAQTLDPSPRQAHIHELWLEINRLTTSAVDNYVVFVADIDADALNRGSACLNHATLLVDDLNAAVTGFYADPDNPVEPVNSIGFAPGCD